MSALDYQRLKTARRIGLFDSGIGGLTVLDKLRNLSSPLSYAASSTHDASNLPAAARQFIYLGDTARCPYGNRQPREINKFVTEIVDWLAGKHVDAIVVACNTSASVALSTARKQCEPPIYDLITPAAHHLAKLGAKVGVMATASTINSRAFSRSIHSVKEDLPVVEIACPDLVPIVEKGEVFSEAAKLILQKYADQLIKEKVEVLVWGCTHFPFLQEPLSRLLPKDMHFVDPAQVLLDLLENKQIDGTYSKEASQSPSDAAIYVTGDRGEFSRVARICLGYSPGTVFGITLDELVNGSAPDKVSRESKSAGDNLPAVPAIQMGT